MTSECSHEQKLAAAEEVAKESAVERKCSHGTNEPEANDSVAATKGGASQTSEDRPKRVSLHLPEADRQQGTNQAPSQLTGYTDVLSRPGQVEVPPGKSDGFAAASS